MIILKNICIINAIDMKVINALVASVIVSLLVDFLDCLMMTWLVSAEIHIILTISLTTSLPFDVKWDEYSFSVGYFMMSKWPTIWDVRQFCLGGFCRVCISGSGIWLDGVVMGILAACEGSLWSKATPLIIAIDILSCSRAGEMVVNNVRFVILKGTGWEQTWIVTKLLIFTIQYIWCIKIHFFAF